MDASNGRSLSLRIWKTRKENALILAIVRASAEGAWHEGPSAIDKSRSAQLGPNKDPSAMADRAVLVTRRFLMQFRGTKREGNI